MSGVEDNRGREGRDGEPAASKKAQRGREVSRDAAREIGATVARVADGVADARDRLDRVEQGLGSCEERLGCLAEEHQSFTLSSIQVSEQKQRLERDDLEAKVTRLLRTFEAEVARKVADLGDGLGEVRALVSSAMGDLAVCKVAVGAHAHSTNVSGARPRVEAPKPKEFSGKRDAKELENYVWQLERYFETVGMRSEQDKVNTATMYLADHAMSWWRRKHAEVQRGECAISSWDELKRELKRQFLPENASQEARRKIRNLRQTKTIAEYVEEFSAAMLQVTNMSDEDLLYDFIEGLEPWAATELHRRGV